MHVWPEIIGVSRTGAEARVGATLKLVQYVRNGTMRVCVVANGLVSNLAEAAKELSLGP